jgi:sarcosine oxidase
VTRSFAVVGAGLTGAATAWRLAQRGEQVTLLERATPANPQGSSHGSARIFRYAYPDLFYASLVVAARPQWDELADAAGTSFLSRTGSLDFGAMRKPGELAAVLDAAGVENAVLTADEAAARWPGIAFDGPVLWTPDAGVIDAQSAVEAMVALAVSAGATVHTGWTVTAITPYEKGVLIGSEDGRELSADHVVLAAGGWLPELLEAVPSVRALVPPLVIRKEQAFHFPYRDAASAPDWPTLIHKSEDILTYSLPGGRDAGFRGQKLAEFSAGPVLGSAAGNDGVIDEHNRERMIAYAQRYLPGLVPTPYAETTCVFTMTPDEGFVIDTAGPVTVASPCSGHGAKFAPLLGSIIADAVTGVAEPDARFRGA